MVRRCICLFLLAAAAARAEPLPRVASINLCTDQLVLSVADPAQIASLSWLAADPRESMLADAASRHALNYGSAEEILNVRPDVVIGGRYTSGFTRAMLGDLGFDVVSIEPAASLADVERNLRIVGAAIGREAHTNDVIAAMHGRIARLEAMRGAPAVPAIVVRPGGFTVGAGTLAHELMQLAGLDNVAARDGLDVWGSLSLESLITSRPGMLVFAGFRDGEPSLANAIFAHPLVTRLRASTPSASIDAPLWSCGIPDSLRSAELLAAALRGPVK